MTEPELHRRQLLVALASGAAAVCCPRLAFAQDESLGIPLESGPAAGLSAQPARWWKSAGELRIECQLCPNKCRVADRERGTCGVRENRDGKYYTLVYGRPCAMHIDPVEKKPFFHVLPGTNALSLAAPGCNIQCKFCQNWEISQVRPEQVKTYVKSPESIVEAARRFGSPTVACTYSEPVVWSEYVFDIAAATKKAGLRTLMVSNGFIEPGAMNDLCGVLGAVKIDLKAMTEKFYKEQCVGKLAPVLDTLRLLVKRQIWTEIVTLVIPGLNDSEQEARELARFVKKDLGPDVPVHFTRFHPSYRLQNLPSTPVATLTRARDIAIAEGLHYVYVGNVPGHPGNNTYCPGCKRLLIRRISMTTLENRIQSGHCPDCKRPIAGIWN
jgi:pyruvate formate lyase activating enzyme